MAGELLNMNISDINNHQYKLSFVLNNRHNNNSHKTIYITSCA
jgi:hypothetical protein